HQSPRTHCFGGHAEISDARSTRCRMSVLNQPYGHAGLAPNWTEEKGCGSGSFPEFAIWAQRPRWVGCRTPDGGAPLIVRAARGEQVRRRRSSGAEGLVLVGGFYVVPVGVDGEGKCSLTVFPDR